MINNLFYFVLSACVFFSCNIIGFFLNPIHSVLCFLFIILLVSIILISLKLYYLAMTLIIIYAGAVVILFLFLIITIIKNYKISFDYKLYWPNNLFLFLFLFIHILFMSIINNKAFTFSGISYDPLKFFIYKLKYNFNDINIFSENLFSEYFLLLSLTILFLFFVLISAIIILKNISISTKTIELENYIKNIKY